VTRYFTDKVSEGATGCQPDKFPVQEEGPMESTEGEDLNTQTGMSIPTQDGFPSDVTNPRWSGFEVYDKGTHAGQFRRRPYDHIDNTINVCLKSSIRC
jgi:hypothetical protein